MMAQTLRIGGAATLDKMGRPFFMGLADGVLRVAWPRHLTFLDYIGPTGKEAPVLRSAADLGQDDAAIDARSRPRWHCPL